MSNIHKTAIVSKNAVIGKNVTIGAYSIIGDKVKIANDNIIHSSVCIDGNTDIDENNEFFPFCSIGSIPQDLKYRGEKSKLVIGKKNTFREYCNANLGTKGDNMQTLIGDGSLFMVGVHIAHDCIIENEVIFANQVTLGGHVHVENKAVIGGISAVHQFCKIGSLAMIGGMSAVENDVIPYSLAIGNRAKVTGINIIGLKRADYTKSQIREYSQAVEKIFTGETISKEINKLINTDNPLIKKLLVFLNKNSSRGLCKYEK
jgi:UDP-N-acetylglucosamine acyltransferase